jgi:hypothetical protein
MLIAQAGGAATSGPSEEVILVCVLLSIGITVLVWFALRLLLLITLARALRECSPRNRRMEPGQVYLNLIPLFRYAWQFVTVQHVTQSLRDEFADRGLPRQGDYANGLGTAFAVTSVCGLVPYIGVLARIAALVLSIVYWLRIAAILRALREAESFGDDEDADYRDRYYDDEDDRYSRRRRSRYDEDDEDDDRPSRRRRSRYDDEGDDDEDDRPSHRRRYDD